MINMQTMVRPFHYSTKERDHLGKLHPKSKDLPKGEQSVGPGHADDISSWTQKGAGSVRARKQILEGQVGITNAGNMQNMRRDRHSGDTGKRPMVAT